MNIGIGRGELQTILAEITDFLEQQREQQGELSEQERGLYETYVTEEETLKQLKLDVDMITNLDQAIDDALGTFMNQINRVKNYESEAWKNFKEIAHILNDTRARELYYMIEGAARNIKTISIYLEQEFFTHFHKLIEDAKTRIARVQSQMDALKEKGVLFQKQAEQLEQQQITAEDQEGEEDEEEAMPKPKLGWIDWIIGGTSEVFGYIWSIIRMPYDMIFGK
jgi:chromosome segregation ATPase